MCSFMEFWTTMKERETRYHCNRGRYNRGQLYNNSGRNISRTSSFKINQKNLIFLYRYLKLLINFSTTTSFFGVLSLKSSVLFSRI